MFVVPHGVSGTVLGTGDTAENKADAGPALLGLRSSGGDSP